MAHFTLILSHNKEMQRREERRSNSEKMKTMFCSADVLSKMFGPAYQVSLSCYKDISTKNILEI